MIPAKPLVAMLGALTLSLALTGCVVEPAPGGYYAGLATVAPPAPQYEYYGVPPQPGWFWIGGNWSWSGGRYVWTRGHWQAPRSGYRWVPHHWVHGSGGWSAEPGHWARR